MNAFFVREAGTPVKCLYLVTFKHGETLAWILHVTGNDRLGTTAIYLNLIDMHVVDVSMNTFKSEVVEDHSRVDSKSWIEPFCGDMQKPPNWPRRVVANNVERSVAPNLAKIAASRV